MTKEERAALVAIRYIDPHRQQVARISYIEGASDQERLDEKHLNEVKEKIIESASQFIRDNQGSLYDAIEYAREDLLESILYDLRETLREI